MNITITGDLSFFARKFQNKDGSERIVLNTYVTRGDKKDNSTIRKSLDLILDRNSFPTENVAKLEEDTCYSMKVEDAWLTLSSYKNKEGKEIKEVAIYVKKGQLIKATPVDTKKRDEARQAFKNKQIAENTSDAGSPLDIKSKGLPF